MIVDSTPLRGVSILRGVRHRDERGELRKVLVIDEARAQGVDLRVREVVATSNTRMGTVRGMHYQVSPFEESKTLWVTRGALFDVLVDLRPLEDTFGQWVSFELSSDDDLALHIPPGVAHGYQTLVDDTCLTYLIGAPHSPDHARTLRWNDPTIGIAWPMDVSVISQRDQEGHLWPPQP